MNRMMNSNANADAGDRASLPVMAEICVGSEDTRALEQKILIGTRYCSKSLPVGDALEFKIQCN